MNRFDYNFSFMSRHEMYKLYPPSGHLAALLTNEPRTKPIPKPRRNEKWFISLTVKRTKRADPCDRIKYANICVTIKKLTDAIK